MPPTQHQKLHPYQTNKSYTLQLGNMDAWKSLSVFAILLFLILFISSGKMLLQPRAALFFVG
jgi:hypothetical protein